MQVKSEAIEVTNKGSGVAKRVFIGVSCSLVQAVISDRLFQ
jgi:hypothetical protein